MTPREALQELAIALNHSGFDESAEVLYIREIAGYDSRDVTIACQRLARTTQWWPKLVELRAAIHEERAIRERLTRGADDPSTLYRCEKCEDARWIVRHCSGHRECGRPVKGIWAPYDDGKKTEYVGSCQVPHSYAERCVCAR